MIEFSHKGAFYNEIEPYAAEWMERLAKEGRIANGTVERRSVRELAAADLEGYGQCHFFAGLGGWSYALRLAGWPDDLEVWTGSCPCQPFSAAGRRGGFADDRHLWPDWFQLIRERRPSVIFGEQVAGPDGLKWLDVVSADLENAGYAFGAADLCAAGVGAPHLRQRLYFVAYASGDTGLYDNMANTESDRRIQGIQNFAGSGERVVEKREPRRVAECGDTGNAVADSESIGRKQQQQQRRDESEAFHARESYGTRSGEGGFWSNCDWLPCRDGKSRAVEPSTFPLANGVSARVGRLRAYGNAIVPQVAAAFVSAVMEIPCLSA